MLGDHEIRFNNQKKSIKIPKVLAEGVTLEHVNRVICTLEKKKKKIEKYNLHNLATNADKLI